MSKWMTGLLSVFGLVSLSLTLNSSQAKAEMYVAGQVGLNIPQSLSKLEYSTGGVTFDGNDQSLESSLIYGIKLGYYFESLKWLGVETEVFKATPHLKQQNVTIGGIDLGTLSGAHVKVITWAPVNIVVRHQMGAFEPYAGIGVGLNVSQFSDRNGSDTGGGSGLNTQLGLRYRITTKLAVFGEWKFNHARLKQRNFLGVEGLDFSANYNAHNVVFGVGYHF